MPILTELPAAVVDSNVVALNFSLAEKFKVHNKLRKCAETEIIWNENSTLISAAPLARILMEAPVVNPTVVAAVP